MTRNAPAPIRPVIVLLLVNLALSAVLALLFVLFRGPLVDYALAHTSLPPGSDVAGAREGLSVGMVSRAVTVAIVAVVYVFLIRGLLAGRRRAWIRVLILSVASLAGIGYIVFSGLYPAWVDVEQGVQAAVLLGLLWAVTRPGVRAHFAPAR